jgi:hypothetical protein
MEDTRKQTDRMSEMEVWFTGACGTVYSFTLMQSMSNEDLGKKDCTVHLTGAFGTNKIN